MDKVVVVIIIIIVLLFFAYLGIGPRVKKEIPAGNNKNNYYY